ncbi:RmlC-like cupin domain-containing protein [Irpex lacteus]|nr:RmlC-like cupin domain-containing protein [Irpex lacteus]
MSPTTFSLEPLTSLRITRHSIPRHARIPNTSIQNRPLLIYHGAFPSDATAAQIESHIRAIGVCEPQWRYSMYKTSHFHSTTHELLVISSGSATLLFGGETNSGKIEETVKKGDVIVVPAGVAHRLMKAEGEDIFEVVGSYPVGAKSWDMCYGREDEDGVEERIRGLGWFERDSVYGQDGPVLAT